MVEVSDRAGDMLREGGQTVRKTVGDGVFIEDATEVSVSTVRAVR